MNRYDFEDPAIRRMVRSSHNPVEIWERTQSGVTYLEAINCDQCGETWPCSPIRSLRFYEKERMVSVKGIGED